MWIRCLVVCLGFGQHPAHTIGHGSLVNQKSVFGSGQRDCDLLEQIHRAIPSDVQARFATLLDKRDALTLTDDEYTELLDLTNQIENLEANRVRLLGELARYRGVTLTQVMQDLGIVTPPLRVHANSL